MTYFEFKGKKIAYTVQGQGFTLVFLHGYLETQAIWTDFARTLSENFRVITLDIPGHGDSEILQETHYMCLMAEAVDGLLQNLNIDKCLMIGHSMGGYVTLSYAEHYAHRLAGFVLFHSSIYSDTPEKKENRRREIELVQQGKKDLIFNTNLPKMFADKNVNTFANTITAIKKTANKHHPDGICALIRGMMKRKDQQALLRNFKKPVLFIFGEQDNYIPVATGKKMLSVNRHVKHKWLAKSGHMGFVEEFELSIQIITRFAKSVQVEI